MIFVDKCVFLIGWLRFEKCFYKDIRSIVIVWLKFSDGKDRYGKYWIEFLYNMFYF